MSNIPLGFPFGFYVADNSPIDGKYGVISAGTWRPYNSVAEALTTLPVGVRYIGLTVNIANVEYWWASSVADAGLVVKSGGSSISFGTQGQVPITNGAGNGFSYSSNFVWDDANRRLTLGSGNTNAQGTDNYVLAPNSQILSGSWNFVTGEEHIMRLAPGAYGGINNNGFFAGYLNVMEKQGGGWGIYNTAIIAAQGSVVAGNKVNCNLLFGQQNKINGNTTGSMVGGIWTEVTGYNAWAHGDQTTNNPGDFTYPTPVQAVLGAGKHAFIFSANSPSQTVGHGALSDYSAILGGVDHHIPADAPRSAILGGSGIKARAGQPDQVYVPNLNIVTAPLNDNALSQILVRDAATGQVKYRDAASLGGGGITNGAAAGELMMSNGTNAVPSGLFTFGEGDLAIGRGLSGSARLLSAESSGPNADLTIATQGNGGITIYPGIGGGSGPVGIYGRNSSNNVGAAALFSTSKLQLMKTSTSSNTVEYIEVSRGSSVAPALGIGTGIQLITMTASNNGEIGSIIESVTTDISAGSEDFDLVFKTMAAGAAPVERVRINDKGVGIGLTPSARLTLAAGTAAANTAPLKLTPGTALTTPENGALEYHSSHLYFTIGSTRYQLDQQGGGGGTGDVVGPASSTDNAIARFDQTTGKLLQNTQATIDDLGNLTLGSSSQAGGRSVSVSSSDTNALLELKSKGSANINVANNKSIAIFFGDALPDISLGNISASDLDIAIATSFFGAGTKSPDLQLLTGDIGPGAGNVGSGDLYLNTGAPRGTGKRGNIAFGSALVSNWQSMEKGLFIANAFAVPTGNPTGGGFLYVENGALKYRGSSGTVTTIANA